MYSKALARGRTDHFHAEEFDEQPARATTLSTHVVTAYITCIAPSVFFPTSFSLSINGLYPQPKGEHFSSTT